MSIQLFRPLTRLNREISQKTRLQLHWYGFCTLFCSQGVWKDPTLVDSKRRRYVRREEAVMDESKLESKLNDLVKEFGGMANPQYSKLAMLAKKAYDNHKRLQKSVDGLQESLDYLRICIKYQLFDLEATRRENKYLRKLLEGKDS